MIRLWISHRTSVPIREQLSAQLLLGILSRRLAPGERLPSIRDLARRLKIHGNTVSSVYSDLARRGWVQSRQGSGVFVKGAQIPERSNGLDDIVRKFIQEAQGRGYSIEDLRSALISEQPASFPVKRLVVVDPEPELGEIFAAEITAAAGQNVGSANLDEARRGFANGTCALVHQGQASGAPGYLGSTPFRVLQLKSMQDILDGVERPARPVLIAVVSKSESILAWASTLLPALGFHSDSIVIRNATAPGWQEGLAACGIVATDVVTASMFPERSKPIVFRVLSEETLTDLRRLMTA